MSKQNETQPLANYFKGCSVDQIPKHFIDKRYGNKEGSFLLMTDGSKMFIDKSDNKCLWVIGG